MTAAVAFTFGSFGDIITVIQLVDQIRRALRETDGALDDIKAFLSDLDAFEHAVQGATALLESGDPVETSVKNGICHALAVCRILLDTIHRKIGDTKRAVADRTSAGYVVGVWKKIGWTIFKSSEVAKSRARLVDQMNAMQTMLSLSQCSELSMIKTRAGEDRTTMLRIYDMVSSLNGRIIAPFDVMDWFAQFSGVLANENIDVKWKFAYWMSSTSTWFTPNAVMKLVLKNNNNDSEVKTFDVPAAFLPQFFYHTTQSGAQSMTIHFGDTERLRTAQALRPAGTRHEVQSKAAIWTYRYSTGAIITLRGNLYARLASHTPKIELLTFQSFSLEEHVPQIVGRQGAAAASEQIDPATIYSPVNVFGMPQPAMRSLELAESVAILKELVNFQHMHNHSGPLDALKIITQECINSGLVHYPVPPNDDDGLVDSICQCDSTESFHEADDFSCTSDCSDEDGFSSEGACEIDAAQHWDSSDVSEIDTETSGAEGLSSDDPPCEISEETRGDGGLPSDDVPSWTTTNAGYWHGDRMFNIYIIDYLRKRGYESSARMLCEEAMVLPEWEPPVYTRQNLLFEWWTAVWALFEESLRTCDFCKPFFEKLKACECSNSRSSLVLNDPPQLASLFSDCPPGSYPPVDWDGDLTLNLYLCEYFRKHDYTATACTLWEEACMPPSTTIKFIDAPRSFIFEWWSAFWIIFDERRSNRPSPNEFNNYIEAKAYAAWLTSRNISIPPI